MEFDNVATARFFLVWCLLATMAIDLTSCHGARAALEAGNNTTIARQCRGGECLIAYQQPDVELMAALDPKHDALASMLASLASGDATKGAKNRNTAGCGRSGRGVRYTPCPPKPNLARPNPYPRNP
ncbi:hypothetical protein BT93_I0879 [Corymbia citriodora subsp. variegata]|nr:hypothetical protein BT93_I0879 [Corymbia citriodora subsp. variegata]